MPSRRAFLGLLAGVSLGCARKQLPPPSPPPAFPGMDATRVAIAHLSFDLGPDRLAANLAKMKRVHKLALAKNADLVLYPEMMLGGLVYPPEVRAFSQEEEAWWRATASSPAYAAALADLQVMAESSQLPILFGGCLAREGALYNALYLAGPSGLKVVREKSKELPFFKEGLPVERMPLTNLRAMHTTPISCVKKTARIASLICAEMGFVSEFAPTLQQAGANLITVSANWIDSSKQEMPTASTVAANVSRVVGLAVMSNYRSETGHTESCVAAAGNVIGRCDTPYDAILIADLSVFSGGATAYAPIRVP